VRGVVNGGAAPLKRPGRCESAQGPGRWTGSVRIGTSVPGHLVPTKPARPGHGRGLSPTRLGPIGKSGGIHPVIDDHPYSSMMQQTHSGSHQAHRTRVENWLGERSEATSSRRLDAGRRRARLPPPATRRDSSVNMLAPREWWGSKGDTVRRPATAGQQSFHTSTTYYADTKVLLPSDGHSKEWSSRCGGGPRLQSTIPRALKRHVVPAGLQEAVGGSMISSSDPSFAGSSGPFGEGRRKVRAGAEGTCRVGRSLMAYVGATTRRYRPEESVGDCLDGGRISSGHDSRYEKGSVLESRNPWSSGAGPSELITMSRGRKLTPRRRLKT
jgi:hypothetical protein